MRSLTVREQVGVMHG